MGKEKQKSLLVAARYILFCAAVVGIVLLCICHASCQITSEGIKVLEAEESPEIKSVKVLSENSIEVEFTKEVSVKTANISKLKPDEAASIDQISENSIEAKGVLSADGKSVVYNFSQSTDIGQNYQLFSEIADTRGNSLTFAVPFIGYNNRMPIIVLEEIGSPQGTKTSKKVVVAKRCEYIILKTLTAGNLGGIELFNPQYPLLSKYQFPAIEVKADESIIIHLRTYDGQAYTEELGNDITLDKNEGARDDMRDLYFVNDKKCLAETFGIVFLRDKNSLEIMDCVLYTIEAEKEKFEKYSETANQAVSSNKWKSNSSDCDPIILEKKLSTTGICLKRQNCNELFDLVQNGKLSQEDVTTSKEDWKTGLPIYSASRK